jgi:NAD(P)-dependent dehydrogenase (short-subunit alcohol dehydrogenase family)
MINNKISETKLDKLFDLKNKKIIVTGSNSGIGLQLSRSLTKLGAKIIRIDKFFNSKLQTDDYICDLRSYNQIINTFKKIKRNFKKISGLVNCAGVSINSNMPYEDINYYDETLNVNLKSAFIVSTEACKIMKKNSSVINITSLGAEQSFPLNPAYQASKSGLRQLTKSFARDYSKYGIRFNNLCPGYIKTKMTIKSYSNPINNKARSKRTLLNSWGKTFDLVGPCIFLLSNGSSYITGSDIYVDGGWMAKGI